MKNAKQEMIESYSNRIVGSRVFEAIAFIFTLHRRIYFHFKLRKLVGTIKNSKRILKAELVKAKNRRDNERLELIRIGLYLCIMQKDLSLLHSRLVMALNPEVKEVYAKQIALILFEFIQDQPKLFGRSYRDIIYKLPDHEKKIDLLKILGMETSLIKKERGGLLKEIRINLAAHRDCNGEKQLQVIEKLDFVEMHRLSMQLYSILGRYLNLLTQVVLELHEKKQDSY